MREMAARYDLLSRSYRRCWAPILAPTALALLDTVEPAVGLIPAARLLDAGTGPGTLALAATRRWPLVRVIGLDVSAGMLAVARAAAAAQLVPAELARLIFLEGSVADPGAAGISPASIDAAISSFVLHLVPDRGAALAGLRAALVPGGALAFVVWAREAKPWAAEAAFETALAAALANAGIAAPALTGGPRAGPIRSAAAARAELLAAGFADVDSWESTLHHPFTRDEARALFVEYDRAAELDALAPGVRDAVVGAFDARLARLSDSELRWDAPLVAARAIRPPDD